MLLLLVGCDDFVFKSGAPSTGEIGDSWSDMQTVFGTHCANCHDSVQKSGELDLVTDPCAAIVNVYSGCGIPYVTPGDHASSALWMRMTADETCGSVMPPSGAIDDAWIQSVADWIDNGADCSGDSG